ncbi:MAG: GTPase Era [Thiotrichales bacterium]|nr:MAG: GTPase Era [Thiotrichales bacterium]
MNDNVFHCGFVAIIGRPNVGKSTLLNHILGQKISITSRKPQTTRHQILGVKTSETSQVIYVDTPGIHNRRSTAINRYMNRAANSVLRDVDLVLFVVQALQWTEEDEVVLDRLQDVKAPVLLVVNKTDKIGDKNELLPYIEKITAMRSFDAVIPVSALHAENIAELEADVYQRMPENAPFFPEDQITDRNVRFLSAEIIREKLIRELGQELPYTTTVEIDRFEEGESITRIFATIYVETKGQKAIIIGRKGARLKSIGSKARADIEKMLDGKVYLELWVKIREGWSNDERALASLGYTNE